MIAQTVILNARANSAKTAVLLGFNRGSGR
jgi:DNA-binding protein Fis